MIISVASGYYTTAAAADAGAAATVAHTHSQTMHQVQVDDKNDKLYSDIQHLN